MRVASVGIVDDFIERFRREKLSFERAAEVVGEQLRDELNEVGVRCIVSHRVKQEESLRNKCIRRNAENPYASVDEVFADIVDLAGVRVALYFPAERDRADRIITRCFELLENRKEFPQGVPDASRNRFFGYSATHYRVKLREANLRDHDATLSHTRVEIQVASVLMHAWSEVGHDLAYKPVQGSLSSAELALLDQLNGLVHAGEIALEQLQEAGIRRTSHAGREFRTHYDLASHIIGYIEDKQGANVVSPEIGRVDKLHAFLQELDLATPQGLSPYLENLSVGLEKRTLSDQIIEAVIDNDPRAVRRLLAVQDSLQEQPNNVGEMYIEFIQRWNELVQKLKSRVSESQSLATSSVIIIARSSGVISEDSFHAMQYLRLRRDAYVHSKSDPDISKLKSDLDLVRPLLATFDSEP
ncbi:GTP pyrophosphokinase [Nocardia rosealba]|uniref:GTP pyrophosphokinase n=1 Tax=Nocardia rosealba TaxID=2878563 RepID=UPI001CDA2BFB|nr:RelA/SpoT domain-containing protein [Nocardia rosealba]MCA2210568.1 RelA/SpoT domain-containing protein [Nocardia rosealba]